MASHLDIGKEGETLAEPDPFGKGDPLLRRNRRCGRYELDLVTFKNDKLRFAEVKFCSCHQYGNPEEAVKKKKSKCCCRRSTKSFLLHPQYDAFRPDVISITQFAPDHVEYFLIEDVTL